MWNVLNWVVLALELVFILCGVLFVARKSSAAKTFIFACMVFGLNFGLYALPWLYSKYVLGDDVNFALQVLSSVSCTIKQFVGEVRIDEVDAYAKLFPIYTWTFCIGAGLAIVTTFGAAISVFGKKIKNSWRVSHMLRGNCCDIVVGGSEDALDYARRNKNTIVLVDEKAEQTYVKSLIGEGYAVLQKNFAAALFDSRYFNDSTHYHVLCLNEEGNAADDIQVILAYLDMRKKQKKIRFFVETDEMVTEIVQGQIDAREAERKKEGAKKRTYREYITIFTRNELIARRFVDAYPITAQMPRELIAPDSSVKPEAKLNVFILGFSKLSKEIYKQFVINNQLAMFQDGEYRLLPLHYYIYDATADSRENNIDGLRHTLETELGDHNEAYFPLPEMPYRTECIRESLYTTSCLREIAEKVKADDMSYLIIDTGDVYQNMLIADRVKLLVNNSEKCRIFVYSETTKLSPDENVICYGETANLFTHEIIVNESLVELAKTINKKYFKDYNDPTGERYKTEEALNAANEEDWRNSTYFNMYSNIYLANNLRLKLHLLGLEYAADGKGEGLELLPHFSEEEKTFESCLKPSVRSAQLAQEHFRWNAYHLLNGYLPMKKAKVGIMKKEGAGPGEKDFDTVRKEGGAKKHACLTTYSGLMQLSQHLADEANALFEGRGYTAEQFEFYNNDALLLELAAEFFAEKGYSVYKR